MPFHPFLFALFPVLALYAQNRGQLSLTDASFLLSLAGVLILTGLLWLGLNLILKNRFRSAILASFYLGVIFSYDAAHNFFSWIRLDLGVIVIGPDKILFPLWVVLILGAGFLAVRTRRGWGLASKFFNAAGVVLVAIPLAFIIPFEASRAAIYLEPASPAVEPVEYDGPTPDIYYLILDRYAAGSTLADFGYDNAPFLNFLSAKGFYVADESVANYSKTHMSLASSLNLTYLDHLTAAYGEDYADFTRVYEMMENYEVWRFLKARGYEFYHLGSAWGPTIRNRYADENVNYCPPREFISILYRTSMFYPVGKNLGPAGRCLYPWDVQYERENFKIAELKEMPQVEGPKFVFAHFLIPHNPYVFRSDCTRPEPDEVLPYINTRDYLNQLNCTNQKITEVVEALLAEAENPPVIVIQADEGPFIHAQWVSQPGSDDWTQISAPALQSHMRILNTYYLPGGEYAGFYPSISPVNSFRLIFNKIFGTEYDLRPDQSFIFLNNEHPYQFFDVTKVVEYR